MKIHSRTNFSYNVNSSVLPMFVYGISDPNEKDKAHLWICDGCRHYFSKTHYYLMIPNPHPEDAMVYGMPYIPYNYNSHGYETDGARHYVHFNWGWNGDSDGWYYYEANPDGYNYTNLRKITLK